MISVGCNSGVVTDIYTLIAWLNLNILHLVWKWTCHWLPFSFAWPNMTFYSCIKHSNASTLRNSLPLSPKSKQYFFSSLLQTENMILCINSHNTFILNSAWLHFCIEGEAEIHWREANIRWKEKSPHGGRLWLIHLEEEHCWWLSHRGHTPAHTHESLNWFPKSPCLTDRQIYTRTSSCNCKHVYAT